MRRPFAEGWSLVDPVERAPRVVDGRAMSRPDARMRFSAWIDRTPRSRAFALALPCGVAFGYTCLGLLDKTLTIPSWLPYAAFAGSLGVVAALVLTARPVAIRENGDARPGVVWTIAIAVVAALLSSALLVFLSGKWPSSAPLLVAAPAGSAFVQWNDAYPPPTASASAVPPPVPPASASASATPTPSAPAPAASSSVPDKPRPPVLGPGSFSTGSTTGNPRTPGRTTSDKPKAPAPRDIVLDEDTE
jgi:hypothetical protein